MVHLSLKSFHHRSEISLFLLKFQYSSFQKFNMAAIRSGNALSNFVRNWSDDGFSHLFVHFLLVHNPTSASLSWIS